MEPVDRESAEMLLNGLPDEPGVLTVQVKLRGLEVTAFREMQKRLDGQPGWTARRLIVDALKEAGLLPAAYTMLARGGTNVRL